MLCTNPTNPRILTEKSGFRLYLEFYREPKVSDIIGGSASNKNRFEPSLHQLDKPA